MFFIEEKVNNRVFRFYDPVYTKDGNIEFKGATMKNMPEKIIYLNDELYFKIQNKTYKYKLDSQNILKLNQLRENMVNEINAFWKRIVTDKEDLIFLRVSDNSDDYLLTTETILDKGHMSPKFNQGLEFVFSERMVGSKLYDGNFSDLLYFLSKIIRSLNKDKNEEYRIKYSSLMQQLKK